MMRRVGMAVALVVTTFSMVLANAPSAEAAGIVTHAWMAMDAVEHVHDPALRALLREHIDQVRGGAEFPDGGYWTRSFGTPGGDWGEEAHWQRFVDAYIAQIRNDPSCGDLTKPQGPCAASVAHLMGAAGHGMGDEVWDWLFEPNAPGFDEDFLPDEWSTVISPGGIEAQMDVEAIARYGRPVGPTPAIPDMNKIMGAFDAIGRSDIRADAIDLGKSALEVERGFEATVAGPFVDALERAMPYTASRMVKSAGGVRFGARAIGAYYEYIWSQLLGHSHRTVVGATAPFDGQRTVPATGWNGSFSPGSWSGNSAGTTRIAASLSSALPYHALAGQGSMSDQLPLGAMTLRDLATGMQVAPRSGYPRIVPYGPDAGEHVVAFQPAGDLMPCRWYEASVTSVLHDWRDQPVTPKHWRFRTAGCVPAKPAPIRGTTHCRATGMLSPTTGAVKLALSNCTGGQDGTPRRGAQLAIAGGIARLQLATAGGLTCSALSGPLTAAASGEVRWADPRGETIGATRLITRSFDPRGTTFLTDAASMAFPSSHLAVRIAAGGACDAATGVIPVAASITTWRD